ncbi:hypothetical protein RGQ29_031895 [Quercus rubra]|uniref:Uncharacterized protein n=1 Tax=Quercus rubra TaxID=3512 RepID=A0AAN7DTC6_QUERU|nr:hypothetical protein RGQ29_031895 [Quercus rubra]
MVNFVTSSYKPELLKPLVEKISSIPEVVSVMNNPTLSFRQILIRQRFCTNSLKNVLVSEEMDQKLFLTFLWNGHHWARQVYGYEVVAQAIADACLNAKLNNIYNATFVQGDLNKIDESFGNNFPKPDVVISDPNRPGMHMKLIKFLLKLKAPRIVYVSCNPATCARDLDYLCHGVIDKNLEGCYKLKSLQAVDMFPHTPHIECVCLLELC